MSEVSASVERTTASSGGTSEHSSLEMDVLRGSSGSSSFLDLLGFSLPALGLSDLSRLLVILVLPGGGDLEGLPSKVESSSGGRPVRGT